MSSRRKGHDFEREFVDILKGSGLDPNAKRHLEYQGEEAYGKDIDTSLPFTFQCKVGRNINIWEAVREVKRGIPVVVAKMNGKNQNERPVTLVSMRLEDWVALVLGLKTCADIELAIARAKEKLHFLL